ncbi:MAG: 50S ribosomal protein L22 [Christensenellaceae bacterium]|jgi:ribosomal protein L22|nr:50S ribosomal protein L22 [Christensenellaceae bacterium]MBS6563901.1 50S ribosomal protein L22 [Clostridiales bacterium]PWM00567.1 MAG: 50S ribosomal protein L22 [Selenomonadales bacterium]
MGKRSALKRARNEEKREHRAHATVKYVRISSRKVRIVINLIRGKKVDEALAILRFTPKSASPVVEKLLNSAIANAEHNMGLSRDTLYVAEIFANQGPSLKRFMPRAKGSASPILKRTSHITVILDEIK